MEDHIQRLALDVHNDTVEMCAKIVEIYRVQHPKSDFQHGYDAAVLYIAAKLRETKKGE